MTDSTQRFLLEHLDVRGEMVSLTESYSQVLAKNTYPPIVTCLLGELLAASALLCNSLKFDGTLILQARSEGAIPLLMAECNSQRQIRGIARYHEEQLNQTTSLNTLMPEGRLAITLDPTHGKRYQGIISLEQETLSQCLSDYFKTSEQLPTFFWLCADGQKARGLLLQALPAEKQHDLEKRQTTWQHLTTLASSLTSHELLTLDNTTILHRLYHEEDIRLFEEQPINFHCSCSKQRSANALLSLGEEDAMALLQEQHGVITIDCQFCNERHLFDAADVIELFKTGSTSTPSKTTH